MPSKYPVAKVMKPQFSAYIRRAKAKRDAISMTKRSVNFIKRIALSTAETKAHFTKQTQQDLDVFDSWLINGLAQGDAVNNRTGSKVTMSSMEWRFSAASVSGTPDPTIFRVMVILDRVPDGSSLSLGDVLNIGGSSDPIHAMRNTDWLEKYKVLMDRVYQVGATSSSYGGTSNTVYDHGYIDLSKLNDKDKLVRYMGTGDTITDININALWFIAVPSNQTAFSAPSSFAQFSHNVKFNFKDP